MASARQPFARARGGPAGTATEATSWADHWWRSNIGKVAARRARPDAEEAEASYRGALSLALELGMRPLMAHCHLGLGQLHRRRGKRDEAREHLTTATAMYREMGMTYWLAQAEAGMKDLT